jgi:Rho GDP-dissociation inhibitor
MFINFVVVLVNKEQVNVGSFAPNEKAYDFVVEEGESPGGMLGRGNYSAKARLMDDENRVHLEAEYIFEIVKA